MTTIRLALAVGGALLAASAAACGGHDAEPARAETLPRVSGTAHTVRDTTLDASFVAAGVAEPAQQATLATKLVGTVTAVLVHEGDAVVAGQPLVRIDARDVAAKQAQVGASIADAEAMRRDAATQAVRIRALYADSAATRAQLDAAETGLARAEAGVRAARAAAGELGAVRDYATVRAPFAGVVTRRFVDPGAFAAPGAPLVSVQDASRLRITVHAAPDAVAALRRGQPIRASIEGRDVHAIVEGVVPAASGRMYAVNALVSNPARDGARALLAGSAATLSLPLGRRAALVVPAAAIRRDGDLTGVTLRRAEGDETRWVRLGRAAGSMVEVSAGLRAGDVIVVPDAKPVATSTSDAAAVAAAGGK